MTMTTEAFPLSWPPGVPRTPAHQRERAKFGRGESKTHTRHDGSAWTSSSKVRLTVPQATDRLLAELGRLGARHIVVSTNVELRLDGLPRGGQRAPDDPGAAVYFNLDGAPHCLPCDRWDRVEDNLAAIAKHIEATRGQLRWGVGDVRTAFAGFKALPAKGETTVGAGGPPWWQLLGVSESAELGEIEGAFRDLAKKHHPDRGGDAGAMAAINRAREQARLARGA